MKKQLILLNLMIGMSLSAQNFSPYDGSRTVTGKLAVFQSGAVFNDGLNFGVQTTFSMYRAIYVAPELFYYPDLRGNTYFHFGSGIGVDFIHTRAVRAHAGIALLLVTRKSMGGQFNASWGYGAGIEWRIPGTSMFIGYEIRNQRRTDTGPREPDYWRINNYAKFGLILF